MNFAEIENMWRSPHNRPTPAQLEKQKMDLNNELNRRRRSTRGLLWLTAIPLIVITAKLVLHMLWPDPALDRFEVAREWLVIPFFLLPWAGWLLMWRLHRGHAVQHRDYARSIRAGVAALLDENRRERLRTGIVVALLLASVPLIGGVVWQLRAVGKAGDEILLPAFVVYPTYVLLMVGWMAHEFFKKIQPRGRELEALLAQYREG